MNVYVLVFDLFLSPYLFYESVLKPEIPPPPPPVEQATVRLNILLYHTHCLKKMKILKTNYVFDMLGPVGRQLTLYWSINFMPYKYNVSVILSI